MGHVLRIVSLTRLRVVIRRHFLVCIGVFTLEHPADLAHGDFACNVAMVAAKQVGKNPKVLADEIVAEIKTPSAFGHSPLAGGESFIESVTIAGPGFINMKLSKSFFEQEIPSIVSSC
jgi:arginyl-tRNA synthetase